jgi:arylsulfatase A-like enzyme
MVKRLDEALGRIEDALRSLSLLENTIILFISDHGNHFKTRNGEYKRSCHDASIHVPCFATGPGFYGGGSVQELVSLVDIPPTLIDAAGIAVPDHLHGHSLLPLLSLPRETGRKRALRAQWPDHVFVQISESETGRAIRTHRWKYSVTELVDGELTQNAAAETYTEVCLYDLEHDPWELENLVNCSSHRAVKQRLRDLLVGRVQSIEGYTPSIVEAPNEPSGQRHVAEHEVAL